MLSHLLWRADSTTLLRLYRALYVASWTTDVRDIHQHQTTVLKMLDPVHNETIRICSGAFHSSLVQSLYTESENLPVQLHRELWTWFTTPGYREIPKLLVKGLWSTIDWIGSPLVGECEIYNRSQFEYLQDSTSWNAPDSTMDQHGPVQYSRTANI